MTLARRLPEADAYTADVTSKVRTETRASCLSVYLICGKIHVRDFEELAQLASDLLASDLLASDLLASDLLASDLLASDHSRQICSRGVHLSC